jgi:hypothetical protein
MKTISKAIFAAATLGAAGVASAQVNINTGDLILFVTDTVTNAAFVQDLGVTAAALSPTGCSSTNGSCSSLNATPTPVVVGSVTNPTVGPGIIVGGIDTALATFLTAQGGGNATNFKYGILGTNGVPGVAFNQSGSVSLLDASPAQMAADYTANYASGGPFATNVASLFYQEPSTSLAVGAYNEITSWLSAVKLGSNSAPYGGTGVGLQAATTISVLNDHNLGSTSYLWEIASNTGDANFYGGSTGITIGTDGSITGLGSAAVPLPAAVWLLGGGLLGLAGIGRRRLA